MTLRITGNRVLATYEIVDKSPGGILIVDAVNSSKKKKLQEGVVVRVGTGKALPNGERVPVPVKVGERIVADKFGCTGIFHENEPFMVVEVESIEGVLDDAQD